MTLRELDEQLSGAYWSTWEDAEDSESYGHLSDLVRDLDDRVDWDESGKLPSKADVEYFLSKKREGEYLLSLNGEPIYVALTSEAFRQKFE